MYLKYIYFWFAMMSIAIINGTIRDFTYKPFVGNLAAHQISTFCLLTLFAVFFYFLFKKYPLQTKSSAWIVGTIWFFMTEIFEFGMGVSTGKSFAELLSTYNICNGQIWVLIPLFVLIGPIIFNTTLKNYRSI